MNSDSVKEKIRILITGSTGFVGKAIKNELEKTELYDIYEMSKHVGVDLCSDKAIDDFFKYEYPSFSYIFHCAVASNTYSDTKYSTINDNLINFNILKMWNERFPQAKFISFGSDACYSDIFPHTEEHFFSGIPNSFYFNYAMAKRNMVAELMKHVEYGNRYLVFIPSSLYGSGFDFRDSHLIHDLIKKLFTLKNNPISTDLLKISKSIGLAQRETVYIDDFVKNVLSISFDDKIYNTIFNLGSLKLFTISEYVKMLCDIIGIDFFSLKFGTMDDLGSNKKYLDSSYAKQCLIHYHDAPIRETLEKTVQYFKSISTL